MYQCLKNINLLTNICRYLNKDSIILFSQCNKTINKALNPQNNAIINLIFMIALNKEFFEFDEDDNNNLTKKNLLSKLLNCKINYKSVLFALNKNFKNYDDKTITQKVLDCFKIHMYLPDLRKDNAHLEYDSSSIHQTICYDILFRSACTYNYYGKYITKEYLAQALQNQKEEKNKEVEDVSILREGLYFEKDLKNFKDVFKNLLNNYDYINIITNVVNYNYEYLNCIYEKKNYYNNCKNNIIKFLLWIIYSFFLYSNYMYKYFTSFKDQVDEKTLLIEFVHKHNEIINCALLLNSNFENINIIINQFINYYSIFKCVDENKSFSIQSEFPPEKSTLTIEISGNKENNNDGSFLSEDSTKSNSSNKSSSPLENTVLPPESTNLPKNSNNNIINTKEKFSLYKLFFYIAKKNVYDKLSIILTQKFNIIINKFYNDLIENFNIKYNKNGKRDNNNLCLCGNNIDLMDIDDDDHENDEDLEDEFIEKEPTEKEIIESYINCEVDFTINERNSNGINHTELIITKEYENIENIIIGKFIDSLKYYMNEGKSNSYLFEIIEKITKCNANPCNISNRNSLILIRRTKKRLMEKSFKLLFKNTLKTLESSFVSHIGFNDNKEKYIYLNDNEIKDNNEYKCDLRDLSSKKRMKVSEAVDNEINMLKNYLIERNIKAYDEEDKKKEIEKLIDDYLKYDGIQEVLLIKKMIWFYYRELGIYEEKNEKITKILSGRKEPPLSESFEVKKELLKGESI